MTFGATLPEPQPPSATPPVASTTPMPIVVPRTGNGKLNVAPGTSARVGSGELIEYRVEVEDNLPVDPATFARIVAATLGDDRGWTKSGRYAFRRTPTAPLRIVLSSPATTDKLCAPIQTRGEVSCRNGNVVAINALRWIEGADSYGDDIDRYRQYVVNHEVGHTFGLGHQGCPGPGRKAPVMLQQTKGLQGCKSNPWP
ncbi:DUF3152 domain-containing protein [Aeromicrobium sp. A1-2]|uniref:DUF3152 domain-containing protein n=1 Tax=Aeromicrobium sp. A1-2 TaxID=2107713 RepID=UPI00352CE6BB